MLYCSVTTAVQASSIESVECLTHPNHKKNMEQNQKSVLSTVFRKLKTTFVAQTAVQG